MDIRTIEGEGVLSSCSLAGDTVTSVGMVGTTLLRTARICCTGAGEGRGDKAWGRKCRIYTDPSQKWKYHIRHYRDNAKQVPGSMGTSQGGSAIHGIKRNTR